MTASVKTKAMVEGALMAVIATILGLAGLFLPLLSLVTSFFIPVPIIILIRKYSLKVGFSSLLVTTFLLMMLSGSPLSGLFLAVQFGGLAIIYGLAFKNGWPAGKSILAGSVIFLLSMGVSILITFLITGINPFAFVDMMDSVRSSMEPLLERMRETGQLEEMARRGISEEDFIMQIEQSFALFKTLIPAVLLFTAILSSYLNYVVARVILKKLQFSVPAMLSFKEWRIPWFAVWIIIIGIAMTLVGDQFTVGLLEAIGQNLILLGLVVFFVMGLAFAIFFYQNSTMSKFLKVIIIIFLIINLPAGVWFLIFMGIGDTLFNFRRFVIPEKEEKEDRN